MRLSISNIAWSRQFDEEIYTFLCDHGYSGLEIAPTTIFPTKPYDHLEDGNEFATTLKARYGLTICSIQSIWYGREENLFGSQDECTTLINYTKQAVDFAVALGCSNLVFGCPRNRNMPVGADIHLAEEFFSKIARYAAENRVIIALEPNPPIYNTNFINKTHEAFSFVEKVGGAGIAVNLDCGAIIENEETLEIIRNQIDLVHHVHISEPLLALIKKRPLHRELAEILTQSRYQNYVSIEMKNLGDLDLLKQTLIYVEKIFQ
jgi:sugar phosphate isomerase/epimerase